MNAQQVGRAGEMFVAAEIHQRGGYAVTFAGDMPGIDILASDLTDSRGISIQVKTSAAERGMRGSRVMERSVLRILARPHTGSSWTWAASILSTSSPHWWARNDIWQVASAYLSSYEKNQGIPGRASITRSTSAGLGHGGRD